jgi:type IV pilus assembly protein PilE
MIMNKTMRGFTLIEAMIVVAVLGIIAALGYPSYRDQVMKSRRSEGMGALLELADRLERYYSDKGTYADVTAGEIFRTETEKKHYKLAIDDTQTSNVKFVITATPENGQEKDKCGTFTLTSQGVKSVSKSGMEDECWK